MFSWLKKLITLVVLVEEIKQEVGQIGDDVDAILVRLSHMEGVCDERHRRD